MSVLTRIAFSRSHKATLQNSSDGTKRLEAGFTLVELMAVLVIMTLAGMIVAAGMPAAQKAYVEAVDAANAQVLLSTTTTRLRDVLSVADPDPTTYAPNKVGTLSGGEKKWNPDYSIVEFVSLETGLYTVIASDGDKDNVAPYNPNNNDNLGLCLIEMQLDYKGDPITTNYRTTPLVPTTATAGKKADLRTSLKDGSITFDKSKGCIKVTGLKVVRGDKPDAIAGAKIPDEGFEIRLVAS